MNNHKSYIFRFLKQAKIRLSIAVFIDIMIVSLIVGFLVGTIVNVLALFVPIYGAFRISFIVVGIVGLIGGIYAIFRFPSQKKTALEMDKRGLKERLTTFLELESEGSSWGDLQAEDTYQAIIGYNLKEHTRICIKKKRLYLLIGMVVLFGVAAVLPSPNKELAIVQHEQREQAKKKIEKVEQAKEELEELKEMEQLTEADLAEIEKMQDILEKTKEELNEATTKEELEKALERLETKALQTLSENKHMESKNKASELKKQLEEFLKKTENQSKDMFSSEELKDIVDEETLQMLKEALGELADELTEEELEKLLEQLEQLEASLSNGSLTKEQLEQLMEAMKNLSKSDGTRMQMAEIMEGTLGISSPSNQSASNQNGQTGVGNGNNSGNGNGTGTGLGTGNGTGQGGNGIGGGKNQGSKHGIEKENNRVSSEEQVTIPGREVGMDENLTGQVIEGESYQSSGGAGLTWSGEKINYDEVVGEYTKEAYSKIEKNEVPKGMEDVVKQYFEGINQ